MKVSYDAEADCGYIAMAKISAGDIARTIPIQIAPEGKLGQVNLDVSLDGRLLGIELVGVAALLPKNVRMTCQPE